MKLIEKIVEKLLNTNYEDFTSFCVTALSLAESDRFFNDKEVKRIKWLIDNVHVDLQTSLYKLDRFVDPNKVNDDPSTYSFSMTVTSDHLINDDDILTKTKRKLKIRSEDLQKYLCNAVQEINTIVYTHLSLYNEDYVMPQDDDSKPESFDDG